MMWVLLKTLKKSAEKLGRSSGPSASDLAHLPGRVTVRPDGKPGVGVHSETVRVEVRPMFATVFIRILDKEAPHPSPCSPQRGLQVRRQDQLFGVTHARHVAELVLASGVYVECPSTALRDSLIRISLSGVPPPPPNRFLRVCGLLRRFQK